jgi:hypothetical protein
LGIESSEKCLKALKPNFKAMEYKFMSLVLAKKIFRLAQKYL